MSWTIDCPKPNLPHARVVRIYAEPIGILVVLENGGGGIAKLMLTTDQALAVAFALTEAVVEHHANYPTVDA